MFILNSILILPLSIKLMWGASFFYAVASLLVWKPFREEKNELMTAFFAFLVSMALALFLMGAGEQWMNMTFGYLGTFSVLVGSLFMLKFPLTFVQEALRKLLWRLVLLAILLLMVWMILSPFAQRVMGIFIMWFMVIVNGFVAGFFIFLAGLRSKEKYFRIKAIGGGAAITSCCIASHFATIAGAVLIGAMFQFIAPIMIIFSIFFGRRYQQH